MVKVLSLAVNLTSPTTNSHLVPYPNILQMSSMISVVKSAGCSYQVAFCSQQPISMVWFGYQKILLIPWGAYAPFLRTWSVPFWHQKLSSLRVEGIGFQDIFSVYSFNWSDNTDVITCHKGESSENRQTNKQTAVVFTVQGVRLSFCEPVWKIILHSQYLNAP